MSAQLINTLNQVMNDGHKKNLIHHFTDDDTLNGRKITIDGRNMTNFGSCSYLGLEHHPALMEGVMDATRRFGTQFSSSRTYASLGLYRELEEQLVDIFARPVVVTASTTLGHLATIPVIVGDNDAVVLDMQVHNSVQMAVQQLKARGVFVTLIRHNDMESLEEKIRQLNGKYDKVWYFADGIYSMYGDFAPMARLEQLMNQYEKFHLYIDDAHGMSWAGENGTGYVCSQLFHHDKMVLAGSLNKSFATAGGFIVFPNEEMARSVRNCGGTLIFCGPIQPPMLGAANASVRLHRSEEIVPIRQKLADLVTFTNNRIAALGLPQFEITDSPLFFIPSGLPRVTYEIVNRMIQDGFYINTAAFPATPMKRGGVRFMVNGNLEQEDVAEMLEALAYHYPRVLADEGSSPEMISRAFAIPEFEVKSSRSELKQASVEEELVVEEHGSIGKIDPQDWDGLMASRGNFTHSTLRMLEYTFSKEELPENNWKFQYFRVKDRSGQTVLNTFFTTVLLKDDMFAPASVSEQVEEVRRLDPYYLTSKTVILGSPITKGNHLFLDREHPQWKEALTQLIHRMQQCVEQEDASQLMLREFRKGADEELKSFLLEQGLIEVDLPNECLIDDLGWADHDDYLQRLGGKYRYNVRKEILPFREQFEIVTDKPATEREVRECYELYENVYDQAFEMNVHRLPFTYFEGICAHPDYDIIRMYLKDDPRPQSERKPIAVMFSHRREENYHALVVGLDYEFVRTHNTYKQILYRTVWRARELGCSHLDLAFTAELEKKKIGARPYPVCLYMQSMDHFNQAVIATMAQARA
ncbi:MAG: aminotransferase class I/II-fold pyridoxal phosphate-dependent enzyme [Saprospiraceae bacterium]|nr:aminotransferase class I/II-fold pyridoxal phosphate-dependent enzyme [Saprospiraceae bacterium]MCB0679542.1 aminotransferase class I/II-fold pyridoxal phosphate-dependent enzyme [Saprospiraceae bacterium]